MTAGPRTAEGRALLAREDYNSRSFPLITADAIIAIEDAAFAQGIAAARAAVEGLTFDQLATTNRARCESADGFGHPLDGWSLSDWLLAATGEFGEAANVAKKLNRVRDGIPGNDRTEEELRADLADEFADAVIYLDLAAQSQGFTLADAIVSKFDRTSAKIGAPHRLAALDSTDRP